MKANYVLTSIPRVSTAGWFCSLSVLPISWVNSRHSSGSWHLRGSKEQPGNTCDSLGSSFRSSSIFRKHIFLYHWLIFLQRSGLLPTRLNGVSVDQYIQLFCIPYYVPKHHGPPTSLALTKWCSSHPPEAPPVSRPFLCTWWSLHLLLPFRLFSWQSSSRPFNIQLKYHFSVKPSLMPSR